LVELQGAAHVAGQLAPGEVEDADLDVLGLRSLLDEVAQPAPGRLERLEGGVVKDGVDLAIEQVVEAGDVTDEQADDLPARGPLVAHAGVPQPPGQRLPG